MSIVEDVSRQMKDAMKAREKARLTALRGMRAALLNEMKKDNSDDLPDEVSITVLRRLEKQRGESIEAFDNAGRLEQADAERAELAVIGEFLPQLADEGTTRKIVAAAIASTGASAAGDLGRVMGAVMKQHKGEVDGNLARKLAAELLEG
ncbi:MAG: GatB/YqeY domain-containing protein [Deltaproteobacteria bacterium]|nr:GatB/YqeY domain-containing protein [Deltaproteobacteria bacterium]